MLVEMDISYDTYCVSENPQKRGHFRADVSAKFSSRFAKTFIKEHADVPYADRLTDSQAYFHVADEAELSRVNYTECFLITAVPA